jgi:outer membrane protein OmpA-like peptidoglycan-associated protein
VGAGYDITTLFGVYGEFVGASTFVSQADEHAMEWRLGARMRVEDFDINLAGGSGLTSGVGTPLFRIVGGFQWAPLTADTDGDGVMDADDNCPTEAEDNDGWEDEDGCPESDNDDDGRPDADDPCPNEAEDNDGFEDEDGCPDNDNDGDGIQDGYDSCPDEAEDVDEDRDEDGCPDNDTDRDGIDDSVDQCIDEQEDFDGFGDEDGCPEEDFDGDGMPDLEDQCPDQAEDADGFEDSDGCPEEGGTPLSAAPAAAAPAADGDGDGVPDQLDNCPAEAGTEANHGCAAVQQVAITSDHLEIEGNVYFDTGRATIQERSFELLMNIAGVLNAHPEISHITVEGHTDARGRAQRNRQLSQQRADAVVQFLVQRGSVSRGRLDGRGFGSDRPVVQNASSDEEHARNRRVEFQITRD